MLDGGRWWWAWTGGGRIASNRFQLRTIGRRTDIHCILQSASRRGPGCWIANAICVRLSVYFMPNRSSSVYLFENNEITLIKLPCAPILYEAPIQIGIIRFTINIREHVIIIIFNFLITFSIFNWMQQLGGHIIAAINFNAYYTVHNAFDKRRQLFIAP